MNQLKLCQYHQGKHLVDECIDGFEELVEKAGYTDRRSIVRKFHLGLDPMIQSHIALMLDGMLLLTRQVHICSCQDDRPGAKELGAHEGEYMLAI